MHRVQEPPYCIQIELTEGCNLRCTFCGLNGIRGNERLYKFMTPATMQSVAEQIALLKWNPRIELAMHGEPSMHPDYVGMVHILRERLPRQHIMLTSNGAGLLRKPGPVANIQALFDAGLNVLALDDYKHAALVPKIREAVYAVTDFPATVFEYPRDKLGNPHYRRKPSDRHLSFVQDIEVATAGTHATLTNHCGCGAPVNDKAVGKKCAKPFREIGVRWDGNMSHCCNDWRGEYRVGNVVTDGLGDLWQSEAMNAARVMLYAGRREFAPCKGCDFTSYRPGLLPDPRGTASLPAPDQGTADTISRALSQGPYTVPVRRPWE